MDFEEQLIKRLEALSAEWKSHFEAPPDIPLQWKIDGRGILWLDNVWICPAEYVNMAKEIFFWAEDTIELFLKDGTLDIVMDDSYTDKFEIKYVERVIKS